MRRCSDCRYEILELKVIHRRRRTGFEETKDFPIRVDDLIAGRYQVRFDALLWSSHRDRLHVHLLPQSPYRQYCKLGGNFQSYYPCRRRNVLSMRR